MFTDKDVEDFGHLDRGGLIRDIRFKDKRIVNLLSQIELYEKLKALTEVQNDTSN